MGKQIRESKFDNPARNRALVTAIAHKIIDERNMYLYSLEAQRKLKISIEGEVTGGTDSDTPTTLYQRVWRRVASEMRRQTSADLGRILSVGQGPGNDEGATSLCDIHHNWRLEKMNNGETMLICNASAVIIARMWDILVRKLAEEKQQARLTNPTR